MTEAEKERAAIVSEVVSNLGGRQVRFIQGIAEQKFVPACRWEDRARQKLRRSGIVEYQPKGRKWLLTSLGLAVRQYLQGQREQIDGGKG